MRDESVNIVKAVEEVLTIGREAKVPVCISHHKVMGKKNWDLQKKTLEMIDAAFKEGISVTCDQYPVYLEPDCAERNSPAMVF